MQAVAELVEQRPRLIRREQRGLALRSLREIADIDDKRRHLAIELLLVAQRGHPGAGTLGGAGKVVAIEQRLVGARGIADLPDPDVRMPHRDILALGKGDAEQAGGAVKGGLKYAVERQVRVYRHIA